MVQTDMLHPWEGGGGTIVCRYDCDTKKEGRKTICAYVRNV